MLSLSTIIKHYKRQDVQNAIIEHVADREVAPRFEESFGTRPDVLAHPRDILDFAQKGATSFHCSEERWQNPLQIATGMKQHELDSLRKGWDLIIDVDCRNWEYAKLIAHTIVKIIRSFGINSVSVKFSGNKGFHIGVPFEAFPEKINGKLASSLFPEGPKRIALYLVHILEEKFTDLIKEKSIDEIAKASKIDNLMKTVCSACGTISDEETKTGFICPICDSHKTSNEIFMLCDKCKKLMTKHEVKPRCQVCGKKAFKKILDISRILEIDTLLMSSRHLYRCPYSLHEKSGLVSVPINPNNTLDFQKTQALPDNVKTDIIFLERKARPNEALHLFMQAFDYRPKSLEEKPLLDIEIPSTAIPEEHFPPCIKQISLGMQDGRKRSLFILINFLRSVGWSYEMVENYVTEWNKRNPEPLRDNYVVGQLRYAKTNKPILPPNCDNASYYQNMGIKCSCRVKNPVQYAKVSMKRGGQNGTKRSKSSAES